MSAQPKTIMVIDSAVNGMHRLTQLCRDGYLLVELECFSLAGMMKATLSLGDPDPKLAQGAA
jgi:hypothetical protein